MAIAAEVAKVSGAIRCEWRGGKDLEGDPSPVLRKPSDFTIPELVRDTLAYVHQERKKILKEIRAKKGRR